MYRLVELLVTLLQSAQLKELLLSPSQGGLLCFVLFSTVSEMLALNKSHFSTDLPVHGRHLQVPPLLFDLTQGNQHVDAVIDSPFYGLPLLFQGLFDNLVEISRTAKFLKHFVGHLSAAKQCVITILSLEHLHYHAADDCQPFPADPSPSIFLAYHLRLLIFHAFLSLLHFYHLFCTI